MDLSRPLPWHAQAWGRFGNALARGAVAHGLLIHGEGGLHKTQLARRMGQSLLCAAPDAEANACGRCKSCLLLKAGTHPDWVEVSPVESAVIKIDQVRALSERLSMRPQIAARQVAMLLPAERMNVAASNALLKTLEEPSGDTHLLLVADRVGRLSATIRSRCQRLPVAPVAGAEGIAEFAAWAGVALPSAASALAISHGDPEAAVQILAPGAWAEWTQLAEQLVDIASGRLAPTQFFALHAKDGARMLERWSGLIAVAMNAEGLDVPELDKLVRLTSRVEMSRLAPLATQLERARSMLGSGVREDLLIYELSCRWAELHSTGRERSA